ncbi:MAG TPA: hypothetical protein VK537_08610 [Galbitalea sp.]|nr:hypothetical protein [Galbitalea sp.]
MSSLRRRVTIPIAIVLAVSSVPLLTGCFGNPIQGVVNAATGGKVKLGGGGGAGSLPSDFPSSVPVYKGKIDSALGLGSGKKEVWNVSVELSGDQTSTIKDELTKGGFKVDESGTAGTDGGTIVANNKTYGVLVVIAKGPTKGTWIANYTVTPAPSSD